MSFRYLRVVDGVNGNRCCEFATLGRSLLGGVPPTNWLANFNGELGMWHDVCSRTPQIPSCTLLCVTHLLRAFLLVAKTLLCFCHIIYIRLRNRQNIKYMTHRHPPPLAGLRDLICKLFHKSL